MKNYLPIEQLQQMQIAASLATPGPWVSSGGKANARVQARVRLAGGGHALYILCAMTRSGWRSGAQVANDASFIAQTGPDRVVALVKEVLEYRLLQRGESEDRKLLRRLAIILSGSDAPGEIKALTVTAQSFVDRCKTLARERNELRASLGILFEPPATDSANAPSGFDECEDRAWVFGVEWAREEFKRINQHLRPASDYIPLPLSKPEANGDTER